MIVTKRGEQRSKPYFAMSETLHYVLHSREIYVMFASAASLFLSFVSDLIFKWKLRSEAGSVIITSRFLPLYYRAVGAAVLPARQSWS